MSFQFCDTKGEFLFIATKVHMNYSMCYSFSRKGTYYRNNALWNNIFKWELNVMFADTWMHVMYDQMKMYYSLNLY